MLMSLYTLCPKDSSKETSKFNDVTFTDDGMIAVADGNYHCGGKKTAAIILYDTTEKEIRTTQPLGNLPPNDPWLYSTGQQINDCTWILNY